MQNKKKKHNRIVMLPRSKQNSIESKISEALINNEISHDAFMTILMKKETIENKTMKRQRSENEKVEQVLIEQGTNIGIDEVITQ